MTAGGLAQKAAGTLGVWVAVCAATFALFRLAPGDPAAIFAQGAGLAGAEVEAALRAAWGVDRPLPAQLADWFGGLIQGDLGRSFRDARPVTADFAARLPWSAAIGLGGLLLGLLVALLLGFRAALHPGGPADQATRALAVLAQCLPAFAVGVVVLWVFAVEFRWIRPLTGGWLERLFLPMALVALFSAGSLARVTRAAFAEVRAAPWFVTALAKGLSPAAALWRHGRRHVALTQLAVLTPEMAWVIGGTAVAEIVFGTPGLSERVVAAVAGRDYPVLQAYAALTAGLVLGARTCAQLLADRLDPRRRA
jgi:ABC-type dipeptide/oligopeptide/nickel transport system permease component